MYAFDQVFAGGEVISGGGVISVHRIRSSAASISRPNRHQQSSVYDADSTMREQLPLIATERIYCGEIKRSRTHENSFAIFVSRKYLTSDKTNPLKKAADNYSHSNSSIATLH